jgi:hypothetical protein
MSGYPGVSTARSATVQVADTESPASGSFPSRIRGMNDVVHFPTPHDEDDRYKTALAVQRLERIPISRNNERRLSSSYIRLG